MEFELAKQIILKATSLLTQIPNTQVNSEKQERILEEMAKMMGFSRDISAYLHAKKNSDADINSATIEEIANKSGIIKKEKDIYNNSRAAIKQDSSLIKDLAVMNKAIVQGINPLLKQGRIIAEIKCTSLAQTLFIQRTVRCMGFNPNDTYLTKLDAYSYSNNDKETIEDQEDIVVGLRVITRKPTLNDSMMKKKNYINDTTASVSNAQIDSQHLNESMMNTTNIDKSDVAAAELFTKTVDTINFYQSNGKMSSFSYCISKNEQARQLFFIDDLSAAGQQFPYKVLLVSSKCVDDAHQFILQEVCPNTKQYRSILQSHKLIPNEDAKVLDIYKYKGGYSALFRASTSMLIYIDDFNSSRNEMIEDVINFVKDNKSVDCGQIKTFSFEKSPPGLEVSVPMFGILRQFSIGKFSLSLHRVLSESNLKNVKLAVQLELLLPKELEGFDMHEVIIASRVSKVGLIGIQKDDKDNAHIVYAESKTNKDLRKLYEKEYRPATEEVLDKFFVWQSEKLTQRRVYNEVYKGTQGQLVCCTSDYPQQGKTIVSVGVKHSSTIFIIVIGDKETVIKRVPLTMLQEEVIDNGKMSVPRLISMASQPIVDKEFTGTQLHHKIQLGIGNLQIHSLSIYLPLK